MNITNISHSIFTPFSGVYSSSIINKSLFDVIDFSESLIANDPNILPIVVSFLNGGLFSFMGSDNMIIGNFPGGKDCKILGNQCIAEGLNTQAGYSTPFSMLNPQTLVIENIINTDFINGCQITLYNLIGGKGPTTVPGIVNNVSNDGTNTYITFSYSLTDHLYGYIALNTDSQAHSDGQNTIASGVNSYAGGNGAVAELPGKFARGDSYFNNPGDGQYSFTAASCITNNDTPTILKVANKLLTIRNNMGYMFIVLIGARRIDGTAHGLFLRYGIIVNNNNSVSLDGSVVTLGSDINSASWNVNITADDVNNALSIAVTGDNDDSIHWKARCDFLEIG